MSVITPPTLFQQAFSGQKAHGWCRAVEIYTERAITIPDTANLQDDFFNLSADQISQLLSFEGITPNDFALFTFIRKMQPAPNGATVPFLFADISNIATGQIHIAARRSPNDFSEVKAGTYVWIFTGAITITYGLLIKNINPQRIKY